jgi:diacylglycerol kinase family enzyme
MHCTVFHNPNAGWGDHSKAELTAALRLAGYETTYCSTKKVEALKKKLRAPADLVVVAGGDGTVAAVVANLANRDRPVAIIPLGTANNIARSLGTFGGPVDLAESWDLKHWRPLDIGVALGPWGTRRFVEAVGIGPFAKVIKKRLKSQGAAALSDGRKALAKIMTRAKPLKICTSLDGNAIPGSLIALEITNIAYGGPGVPLAPDTDPGDGLLEIVAVEAERRDDMVAWLSDPHAAPPPVLRCRGHHLTLVMEDAPLRLDDEYFPPPDQPETVSVQLEDSPVKVLVRPPAAQRHVSSSGIFAHAHKPV